MAYMEKCIDGLLSTIYYIHNLFPVQSTLYYTYMTFCKVAVAQLVGLLSYKPEGRGFDYRWRSWNFTLT